MLESLAKVYDMDTLRLELAMILVLWTEMEALAVEALQERSSVSSSKLFW